MRQWNGFTSPTCFRRLIAPLVAAVVGCGSPTQPDPAFDPAIVTDGAVFTVDNFGVMRQGWIPHAFTNPTEDSIYISHCGGEFGMILERKVRNRWETFWSFSPNACLSLPPIEIGPGETHSVTLFIYGFAPDDYRGPTLAPEPGPFRIRWDESLVFSFDPAPPWGDPIPEELRISNEFELVLE